LRVQAVFAGVNGILIAHVGSVVADLTREIRFSARSLARTPAWTLSLVLTIALGIASNASVDGFVRGLLTQGPPLPGDAVGMFAEGAQRPAGPLSYDQFTALRSRTDLFRAVGAVRETQEEAWLHKRRLLVAVATITPEIAELLQLPGDGGIVVSHRVWDDDFVGVPVDGQSMQINGADSPVVGVAPEWLEGLYKGRAIDLWIRDESPPADRSIASYWVVGRLREGITREVAQSSLSGSTALAGCSASPRSPCW